VITGLLSVALALWLFVSILGAPAMHAVARYFMFGPDQEQDDDQGPQTSA
jgi:hypothetical protein